MKTPGKKSFVAFENKTTKTNTPPHKKKTLCQGTNTLNTPKAKNINLKTSPYKRGFPVTKGRKHLNPSQSEKKCQKGIKRGHQDKHEQEKNALPKEVSLQIPSLHTTFKHVFEKILPHCVDIEPRAHNLLILKLSQTKFDDSLAVLKSLTFEGKKLYIHDNYKPVNQELKKIMKLSKFGVKLEELKRHYNASSVEHLPTKGGFKPFYVLTFESKEAAKAVRKKNFSFDGKEFFLANFYIYPEGEFMDVKEFGEGSVTKKMKTNSRDKTTERGFSVMEKKQEEEDVVDEEDDVDEEEDEDVDM